MSNWTIIDRIKSKSVIPAKCCSLFGEYAWAVYSGQRQEEYLVRVKSHYCPVCGRKIDDTSRKAQ